jgi:hypothetical protein
VTLVVSLENCASQSLWRHSKHACTQGDLWNCGKLYQRIRCSRGGCVGSSPMISLSVITRPSSSEKPLGLSFPTFPQKICSPQAPSWTTQQRGKDTVPHQSTGNKQKYSSNNEKHGIVAAGTPIPPPPKATPEIDPTPPNITEPYNGRETLIPEIPLQHIRQPTEENKPHLELLKLWWGMVSFPRCWVVPLGAWGQVEAACPIGEEGYIALFSRLFSPLKLSVSRPCWLG